MSSTTSSSRLRARTLGMLIRERRRRWIALGALVAVASAMLLAAPLVVREVVDRATAGAGAAELRRLALVFLAIVVVGQVVEVLVARSATSAAWRTTNDLRLRITRHVLQLDHEFHRRHTPGELIQRVDGDVTSVSDLLGRVLPKALGAVMVVGGMIVVLGVLDWRLGLGMLVYVGLAAVLVQLTRHRAVAESSDEMGALARLYGGIEERLTAAEDLRANGAGGHAMWRFVEESSDAFGSAVRRESAFLGLWWAVQGTVIGGTVLAVVASALLLSQGVIGLGTAFLLFQYVLLIERPLEEVVHELETVQKASGAMSRVGALLAVEPSIRDTGTVSPRAGALLIEFDAVRFDYADGTDDDAPPVLDDVTLTIAAGRSVGVVGRTGSGKTTFSRLVLRLVEPTSGTIRFGGVPIDDIPMAELRRRVALVPQEVELFGGTIRENVTLFGAGGIDIADDAVRRALGAVGLDQLAAGDLDRQLGAGGAGLSAGEAQLLAMARVWLRDPDLLVLDEATARIDPETEVKVESAVRSLISGRTTIVIAHRLSTLREVDEIVMFDAGRVVEHGVRDELAAAPASRYHRLLTLALERDTEVSLDTDAVDPVLGPALGHFEGEELLA
jgi:ABC-type multidrug transport system fused ATPase/permease subunit